MLLFFRTAFFQTNGNDMTKVLSNFSIFLIKAAIWKKKKKNSFHWKEYNFRANSSTIDTFKFTRD